MVVVWVNLYFDSRSRNRSRKLRHSPHENSGKKFFLKRKPVRHSLDGCLSRVSLTLPAVVTALCQGQDTRHKL
jgi:hypothetical protein